MVCGKKGQYNKTKKKTVVHICVCLQFKHLEICAGGDSTVLDISDAYLIFVFFFTQAKFLENKIYTKIYTVNCQFTQ